MTPRLVPSPRRALPVLTVLVLLGSALSLVLALTRPDPQPPADLPGAVPGPYVAARLAGPGGSAVEAMTRVLPIVLGYDFRELDEGLSAATGVMTKAFARRYRRSFNGSARPLAKRQRSVVEAEVRGAGQVRLIDEETVLGLAYVDQVLVRSAEEESSDLPRTLERYRVLVRLVKVGDDWLVANISPV